MARQPAVPLQQQPRVDQVASKGMPDAIKEALFHAFPAWDRQHSASG